MKSKTLYLTNRYFLYLVCLFFIVVAMIFRYTMMDEKNFISATYIYRLMHDPTVRETANNWVTTAKVYSLIDIFHLKSQFVWSVCLLLFILPFFFAALKRIAKETENRMSINQFVYLCSIVFLLGCYVFCLSKDYWQLLIFGEMNLIIHTKKIHNQLAKAFIISILFSLLSLIFKTYYILFGFFSIVLFFILEYVIKKGINQSKKKQYKNIIVCSLLVIAIIVIFMLVAKLLFPQEYTELIIVRSKTYGVLEANTEITDILNNSSGSLLIWLINYIIGLFRMLFPIELLMKGISYLPFVVYQIIVSSFVIVYLRDFGKRESEASLILSVIMSFILVSGIFEPDFGSWVRHSTTTFFLINHIVFPRRCNVHSLN